jgi:Uncharacterised protein family (UPF0236)
MKFSTQTIRAIQELLVEDFKRQVREEAIGVDEIEQALREGLQGIGRNSYGEMLSLLDEHQYQVEERCKCQEMGKRVSRREAQLLSVFGRATYKRSYYHCADCGRRWMPLDESQELRPGRATRLMSSLLGIAGVSVAFEEAQHQIQRYLQVEVSPNTIRQETQWIGEKQAEQERLWQEGSQDLTYLQQREQAPERPQRLYGSMDGAFVPVEQEWKEAKLISWYQVGERYGHNELHAQAIHHYVSLEDATKFGELVWATAVEHQADRAEELVFVCDGAAWIWKLIEQYFPQAVQIVDWYHACQYLYPVAEALFEAPELQTEWVDKMKAFLWEGEVEVVIQTCQNLQVKVGTAVQRLITYYRNNQERMRYASFRQANYLIGSGTVESGCKQVVSLRLKRSGATWSLAGASATAKARAAWLSGSWDSLCSLPVAA